MNASAVRAVMAEASHCAMVMLANAAYIQRELPNVHIDDSLRATTEGVCSQLVGTKHDIITEVSELDELLGSQASASVVTARVDRIVQWLRHDVVQMDELVNALAAASKRDPACGGASILVTESAANILKAFIRTKAAADAFHAQAP